MFPWKTVLVFCIVMYDDRPYVGKILNIVGGALEVTVMHQRGRFGPLILMCYFTKKNR